MLIDFDEMFCFQRHIGLIRPNNSITVQKWLFYLLQSNLVYRQAKKKTGTAQKTVALGTLRKIQIPLCSIQEQHQIVKEIESRLSVCDKVEESISESWKRLKP